MVQLFIVVLGALRVFFRSRSDAALEILALRQQVAVLKRRGPRPPLNACDRLFWTALRRFWLRWSKVLVIVLPKKLSSDGTAPAFVSTGAGDREHAAVDRELHRNCGT